MTLLGGVGEMMPDSVWHESSSSGTALFTDLYELTMLRAYSELGMSDIAVFDLFFRKLPPQRNIFWPAASTPFSGSGKSRLQRERSRLPVFAPVSPNVHRPLRDFRFTGDVYAVPEEHRSFRRADS